MFAWWESLSTFSQVLACMAIPATLILLIQTILTLIGIGDNGVDSDIGDADIDADAADGVFGAELTDGDSDPSGLDGLRIFSVRGIIAFFVVFGWTGILLDSLSLSPVISVGVGAVAGFLIMLLIALLFRAVMKLESDGNVDNRNALGVSGTVYLKIPPNREGTGKVNIMIQGSYCERDAVTDENEALPTGCEIVVMSLSGQNTLVVKRE